MWRGAAAKPKAFFFGQYMLMQVFCAMSMLSGMASNTLGTGSTDSLALIKAYKSLIIYYSSIPR